MNKELLVGEVMIKLNNFPIVHEKEVLTDGDIRRLILKVQKPISATFVDDAFSYATKNFAYVYEETPLEKALLKMEKLRIWDLPVINIQRELKGLLHLHPALKLVLGISSN